MSCLTSSLRKVSSTSSRRSISRWARSRSWRISRSPPSRTLRRTPGVAPPPPRAARRPPPGAVARLARLALAPLARLAADVGLGALRLELGQVGLELLLAGLDVGVAPAPGGGALRAAPRPPRRGRAGARGCASPR